MVWSLLIKATFCSGMLPWQLFHIRVKVNPRKTISPGFYAQCSFPWSDFPPSHHLVGFILFIFTIICLDHLNSKGWNPCRSLILAVQSGDPGLDSSTTEEGLWSICGSSRIDPPPLQGLWWEPCAARHTVLGSASTQGMVPLLCGYLHLLTLHN